MQRIQDLEEDKVKMAEQLAEVRALVEKQDPLALARSLLPPGHIRTQHNTRARSRRGIMMEADSALSMGRDRHPPPAVRSPALGPARCGSRLSTSEFESEGAHSSCPPPNLHISWGGVGGFAK